jgi:tryptophan halogenase
MSTAVARVVIVGGGTAGWLTACILAARHPYRIRAGSLTVTLVESPDIPIIGVGEGTWPSLRSTLEKIGVSEGDFFRDCDAAFKQGVKFTGWTTGAAEDIYCHPLVMPQGFQQVNLAPHWLAAQGTLRFCDIACTQTRTWERHLAPKLASMPEYAGLINYAYHLDAGKFAGFLTRHGTSRLGVNHVLSHVRGVTQSDQGEILAVATDGGEIPGDLFVDCTGAGALLIGQALGVPYRDCSDVLFCDTALAVQVPYPEPEAPIASCTLAAAQSAGWIWDIGLPTRRGVGYVYSGRHTTAQRAQDELAAYVGPAIGQLNVRTIKLRAGHRQQRWKYNCVAVGMSAGFLEPLEASAIVQIEMSATWIAEQLPACREVMDIVAGRFNDYTLYHWGRIIDFLKLHYVLSRRSDGPFWTDNLDPATIPESLQQSLRLWKYQSPWIRDGLERSEETFPAASYQYVLYGMGFRGEVVREELAQTKALANRAMSENLALTQRLLEQLPSNREWIRANRAHAPGVAGATAR